MGKVWPAGSIALHESTTPLSNIVSIDESPLMEGLIYVGTDDGLVQITEDGGKTWRKVEDFPGVPSGRTSRTCSPRRAIRTSCSRRSTTGSAATTSRTSCAATIAAGRGRTSPATCRRSTTCGRSRRITSNGNLLFAGTEFGLFFTVDGGRRWVQLSGGMPPTQVRDMQIQKRESDVVMGTFGRGFWILDDYSALREVSAQAMAEEARLFPMRHAYQFQPWGVRRTVGRAGDARAATSRCRIRRTARCSRITCARRCRPTRGWW